MSVSKIDKQLGNSEVDAILGTPSSQQIIRLLSIWSELSIKEIQEKLLISETQIHNTLKNLISINVIKKIRRGIYALATNIFADNLKNAFISNSTEIISNKIYYIQQKLKSKEIEIANAEFESLVLLYKPLLETRFAYIMNSLTHSFLEYYGL